MTAVTQTEAFVKLDEGTVKDFITKVLQYFQHYTLPRLHKVEPSSRDDGEGGGLTQNRNCKMERTGTLQIAERMYYQGPQGSLYFLSPHGLLPIQLSCDRQIEVSFLITLLFPLCHLCTIDVMNKPIMNVNPIYPEGIWMFCPNPPISQWESHCYCNIVATRKTQ